MFVSTREAVRTPKTINSTVTAAATPIDAPEPVPADATIGPIQFWAASINRPPTQPRSTMRNATKMGAANANARFMGAPRDPALPCVAAP